MPEPYDLIVIGAGPGGYVAAIRAAQLGLKTAVVEREHLGGICLNWGCIPTKALLRSADVFRLARAAGDFGLTVTEPGFDIAKIVARSREVAGKLNAGVEFLLKKNKVDVIFGQALLKGAGAVEVSPTQKPAVTPQAPKPKGALGPGVYSAKNIIVATGARPRVLPGMEPDGRLIWTYFEALKPAKLPKSLLIVGAGAIGVEFASFYRTFGVSVTLVEALPRILPAEDAEIAALARKSFVRQGIEILDGDKRLGGREARRRRDRDADRRGRRDAKNRGGTAAFGGRRRRQCRGARTRGAGRQDRARRHRRGRARAPPMSREFSRLATWRAGRCWPTRPSMRASPASRRSRAKTRIRARKHPSPACTYAHPQVASVGLTEADAKVAGFELKIGRFPLSANGKAIALGEPEGLVKTIFDAKSGRLLGAHIIGAEATELIQGFVIAMNLETTEEELMHSVFPHPTVSEAMHESVLRAYGRAIHI